MRVIIKGDVYEMDKQQLQGVLNIAKSSVKMGIYATEKDGIVELKNKPITDKGELTEAVAEYEKNGFKVYYNG